MDRQYIIDKIMEISKRWYKLFPYPGRDHYYEDMEKINSEMELYKNLLKQNKKDNQVNKYQ